MDYILTNIFETLNKNNSIGVIYSSYTFENIQLFQFGALLQAPIEAWVPLANI